MSTVKITLVQADGEAVIIEDAAVGVSLMEVAKAHGVDGILGDCGGGCACATCHVYVPSGLISWARRTQSRR